MEIKRIDYDFSVCKVADYAYANLNTEYSFVGKTDKEKALGVLKDAGYEIIE